MTMKLLETPIIGVPVGERVPVTLYDSKKDEMHTVVAKRDDVDKFLASRQRIKEQEATKAIGDIGLASIVCALGGALLTKMNKVPSYWLSIPAGAFIGTVVGGFNVVFNKVFSPVPNPSITKLNDSFISQHSEENS